MSLVKRTYVDGQTVITAQNLNSIQDEIIANAQNIEAVYTKTETDTLLSGKQDTISDLSTIRSGAALGATALQSVPSGYATEAWVEGKGYLTQHQSLAAYRTSAAQDVIDNGKLSLSGGTMVGDIRMGQINASRRKITMLADPTVDFDAANKKYVDTAIASVGGVKEITADEFAQSGYGYIAFYVSTLADGLYSYKPDNNTSLFFVKTSVGGVASVYEYNTDSSSSSFRILMGYGSAMQQVASMSATGMSYGDNANRETVASTSYVDAAIGGAIGGAY